MVSRCFPLTSIRAIATARSSAQSKTASWPCGWAGRRSRGCRRARRRRSSAQRTARPFSLLRRFRCPHRLHDGSPVSIGGCRCVPLARSLSPAGLLDVARGDTVLSHCLPISPTNPRRHYRGFRPRKKSSMTIMPRDFRFAAIPSLRCASLSKPQRVVTAAALQELKAKRRYRVAGLVLVQAAPGNSQGNHVHDSRR